MHPNGKLINTFYTCFEQLDAQGMAACYHADICFSDPVFPDLRGSQVGAMWKMLCSQAKGFELSFSNISANDKIGKAHWEAKYDFTATHRRVHNRINAEFKFQDGKIIEHQDSFNFWKWSFMALGPVGLMLGWSPMLRSKVRLQAAKGLEKFIRS
jgi:hypothetical protein